MTPRITPYTAGGSIAERPKRIQRRRAKGWRMPEGSIYCGRPSRHANPHDWREWRDAWPFPNDLGARDRWCKEMAVDAFIEDVREGVVKIDADALRGHDLACWCARHDPCHADVLLELANAPEIQP